MPEMIVISPKFFQDYNHKDNEDGYNVFGSRMALDGIYYAAVESAKTNPKIFKGYPIVLKKKSQKDFPAPPIL